jgi:hypothetical protein
MKLAWFIAILLLLAAIGLAWWLSKRKDRY